MNKNIISPFVSTMLMIGSIFMLACITYIGIRCVVDGEFVQQTLGWVLLGVSAVAGATMPKVFMDKN